MASVVLAHVLGGGTGLTSRLFREVREKRGLAYSVSASRSPPSNRRAFCYGGTTTKNERAARIARGDRGTKSSISRAAASTEEELEKGKRYLVGSYPLRFDTSTKIAGQLVHIQLEGHGPEWLDRAQPR